MKDLKALAIQRNPIESYIRATGRTINTKGKEPTVCCFLHDDKNPSMRFNPEKGSWYCDPCGVGGNVIDLHMAIKGQSFAEAVKELAGEREPIKHNRTIEYTYDDAYGNEVFQVQRIEKDGKKTFRQSHLKDGKRVWSMDGVSRVLYRLDKIQDKEQVFLVEGEKCVAALVRMQFDATTNCGGSSNWLDGYAESLRDKAVVIMPDNDPAGDKWYSSVLSSLVGVAKSIQTIRMPSPYNDVGDLYADKGDGACDVMFDLMEKEAIVSRGADVPIFSADELMGIYVKDVTAKHRIVLDLGKWMPSLRQKLRPLVRGDMFMVMSATGTGKSAVLQNIAISDPSLTFLFFEIELPETLMAERFTAIQEDMDAVMVEKNVKAGKRFGTEGWGHIYTCTLGGLDVSRIEEIINQSELKIGKRPDVVLIDYIGLIQGSGSRYERMSDNAERLKVIAKQTNVVMGIASQLKRKDEGDIEVYQSDAKDSGSIENSCGVILGLWRPEAAEMKIKILKDTKGGSTGDIIDARHHGGSLVISERTNF